MRHETRTICAECGKEFDTYEPVIVCPECVASPENELDYQRRMALAYQAEAKDLRVALAERDAKIRELAKYCTERKAEVREVAFDLEPTAVGEAGAFHDTLVMMRRFGLIVEEPT